MGIILSMIMGLIVGLVAKAVVPGRDPGGLIVTMLIGIGGGLLGAAMSGLFFVYLATPVDQLMQLYDSNRAFEGLGFMGVLNMMLFGGSIGLLSAWQAAAVQLRQMEPR